MVKYLPCYNSPIFDLVQLSQNPWRAKQANIFLLSKTGNNVMIPFAIPGGKNPVQSNTHKNKLHRTDRYLIKPKQSPLTHTEVSQSYSLKQCLLHLDPD